MLTVIFIAAGLIVLIGVGVLVLRSGSAGKRPRQRGSDEVTSQGDQRSRASAPRTTGGDV